MSTDFTQSFTAPNFTTVQTATPYVKISGVDALTYSNRCRPYGAAKYRYPTAATGADQSISGLLVIGDFSDESNHWFVQTLGMATDGSTGYAGGWHKGAWKLFRIDAGVLVQIGTSVAQNSRNFSRTFEVRRVGSTLSLRLDGSTTDSITVTDATYSAIGVYGFDAQGTIDLDDVVAVTIEAAGNTGTASITLDAVTLSAAGTNASPPSNTGDASITLDGITLSADGTNQPAGTGTLTIPAAYRTVVNKFAAAWASQPMLFQVQDSTTGALSQTISTTLDASGVLSAYQFSHASYVAGRKYLLWPIVGTLASGTQGHGFPVTAT